MTYEEIRGRQSNGGEGEKPWRNVKEKEKDYALKLRRGEQRNKKKIALGGPRKEKSIIQAKKTKGIVGLKQQNRRVFDDGTRSKARNRGRRRQRVPKEETNRSRFRGEKRGREDGSGAGSLKKCISEQ